MKGTLFLAGGGDENQSYKFDELFLQRVTSILYIPIAWKNNNFTDCLNWFQNAMAKHKNIKIEMLTDLSKAINLKQFEAIYLGGGNTFKLLKSIKDSKFDKKLIDYYQKGGKIYGGSAGAIIFGKSIETAKLCKDADKNKVGLKNTSGLNLIPFDIQCHFEEDQIKEHQSYNKKTSRNIICIPEESGLILKDNQLKVEGEKPITIITEKAITKINPGEIIT